MWRPSPLHKRARERHPAAPQCPPPKKDPKMPPKIPAHVTFILRDQHQETQKICNSIQLKYHDPDRERQTGPHSRNSRHSSVHTPTYQSTPVPSPPPSKLQRANSNTIAFKTKVNAINYLCTPLQQQHECSSAETTPKCPQLRLLRQHVGPAKW